MKHLSKFSFLILCVILFSCKKETQSSSDEQKMNELAEKYHLTRAEGTADPKGRRFTSLGEFETFLANRKLPQLLHATAKVEQAPTTKATGSVEGVPNGYWAHLQFDEYTTDVVPDRLVLSWGHTYVYSEVGYSPHHQNRPTWSWHYESSAGDASQQGTLQGGGAYIETYYAPNGEVWTRRYRTEISATWDPSGINANMYFY